MNDNIDEIHNKENILKYGNFFQNNNSLNFDMMNKNQNISFMNSPNIFYFNYPFNNFVYNINPFFHLINNSIPSFNNNKLSFYNLKDSNHNLNDNNIKNNILNSDKLLNNFKDKNFINDSQIVNNINMNIGNINNYLTSEDKSKVFSNFCNSS